MEASRRAFQSFALQLQEKTPGPDGEGLEGSETLPDHFVVYFGRVETPSRPKLACRLEATWLHVVNLGLVESRVAVISA